MRPVDFSSVFKVPNLRPSYEISNPADVESLRFTVSSMAEAEELLKGITGNFRVRLQNAVEMPAKEDDELKQSNGLTNGNDQSNGTNQETRNVQEDSTTLWHQG